MNILNAALRYAGRGWPVFPCDARKHPLTPHGFKDASTDERRLVEWWMRWPHALIGIPTGTPIGAVVLDIDVKNGNNGFRTLDQLDGPIRPVTPTAITASGGGHLYFARPTEFVLRNTTGERGRGIGPGLDWRGDGGYVIVPAPGTGYRWSRWHFGNCAPMPVPEHLLPKPATEASGRASPDQGAQPVIHQASLAGILRHLRSAREGNRNSALHWAGCRFAEAIQKKLLFEEDARALLLEAALDAGLPEREAAATISSAFRGV
jgi:Bifunctional DNA primase/polymerase, N-terminal